MSTRNDEGIKLLFMPFVAPKSYKARLGQKSDGDCSEVKLNLRGFERAKRRINPILYFWISISPAENAFPGSVTRERGDSISNSLNLMYAIQAARTVGSSDRAATTFSSGFFIRYSLDLRNRYKKN
jgi:hypothetical protein